MRGLRPVSSLPPHAWDDPAHRAQIHQVFDQWFQAYEQGARKQAASLQQTLRRLTEEAYVRELAHRYTGIRAVV